MGVVKEGLWEEVTFNQDLQYKKDPAILRSREEYLAKGTACVKAWITRACLRS